MMGATFTTPGVGAKKKRSSLLGTGKLAPDTQLPHNRAEGAGLLVGDPL
jgi:hypothetical protein